MQFSSARAVGIEDKDDLERQKNDGGQPSHKEEKNCAETDEDDEKKNLGFKKHSVDWFLLFSLKFFWDYILSFSPREEKSALSNFFFKESYSYNDVLFGFGSASQPLFSQAARLSPLMAYRL